MTEMTDTEQLVGITHAIAAAISRRDVRTLADMLAPGFVYRAPGAASSDSADFLRNVAAIPGVIVFVKIDHVRVDLGGDAALVTGLQHAQVNIDGKLVDDRRAFADFFIRIDGDWRLRAAVDFATPAAAAAAEGS